MSTILSAILTSLLLAPAPKAGVKCTIQGVIDSEASKLTAFRYLVPEGWEAHSSFRWMPPNRNVFISDLSLGTPDLHTIVDCVEHTVMQYSSGFGNQPGKGVLITKASDFLRDRASKLASALHSDSPPEIIDEQNNELPPDVFQKMGEGKPPSDSMHSTTYLHQAGYLKVRFNVKGVSMTADMGTQVFGETSVIRIPGQARPSSVSQVNKVGPTLTIMLETNATPQRRREAKIVAASFQMTSEFHAYWMKMTNHAAQVTIGANKAELAAENRNWHEHSMAVFRHQMEAKSQTTHEFCNIAANQQDYKLGQGIVTLPNDYVGWYDATNHVLMLDDDPQFVPSGAGTKDYRRLEKAQG